MQESPDVLGYGEWDDRDHVIPAEFQLDEKSSLQAALSVFYAAGGYDFFRVCNAEKYAANWLHFVGDLYRDIDDGKYADDGRPYRIPLSEEERNSLIEQGVPEIFTTDL